MRPVLVASVRDPRRNFNYFAGDFVAGRNKRRALIALVD